MAVATARNESILLDPELTAEEKILARCSTTNVVPFDQLFPEDVLRDSKKVRAIFEPL
jgi:hypothetical protein